MATKKRENKMKYNHLKHITSAFITLAIVLFAHSAWAKGKKIRVVTSTPDLAAITMAIGGEHVEVTSLARHTEDPHYVDPRPSHIVKLNKADLLVVNGLELEVGWLPGLVVQARNKNIQAGAQGYLDASSVVKLLQVPTQAIDRSQGDIHPGGNPHFTYDPRRALNIAAAVEKKLAALDPDHKKDYAKNNESFSSDLGTVIKTYEDKFAKLSSEQKQVVTYHASTIYISDWLGLKEVMQVEPKPGIAPNPKHIATVLTAMRKQNVHLIFQESFYPKKASQKLAQLAKGDLVVIPGGTNVSDGQTYIKRIKTMADAIYKAASK